MQFTLHCKVQDVNAWVGFSRMMSVAAAPVR